MLLLGAIVLLPGCKDDNTVDPPQETGVYTIKGKLKFNKPATVPANARVLVGWEVSSGSPDYVYMFGEGKVNMADSTYSIVFKKDPPIEALNRRDSTYGLGVGIILLTTDQTVTEGVLPKNKLDDSSDAIGVVSDYAVVYIKGSSDSVAQLREWTRAFHAGFNAGQVVRSTTDFDSFIPIQPNLLDLIIDYFANYKGINWT
jgi:hypothetical protein